MTNFLLLADFFYVKKVCSLHFTKFFKTKTVRRYCIDNIIFVCFCDFFKSGKLELHMALAQLNRAASEIKKAFLLIGKQGVDFENAVWRLSLRFEKAPDKKVPAAELL